MLSTKSEDSIISIHSLRVEGDINENVKILSTVVFQSTPSVWRETQNVLALFQFYIISIHSLRVEGDLHHRYVFVTYKYFNPLPPCGGRRLLGTVWISLYDFNPLPPCGGRPKLIKQVE